jgi:hypothetical protein
MKQHLGLASIIIGIVLIIGLCGAAFWYSSGDLRSLFTKHTTSSNDLPQQIPLPNVQVQSQSDGTITFTLPDTFGLATTKDQVLVKSYIPPCEDGFLYCLYYKGNQFEGTNFDSAGVTITKRDDLKDAQACTSTAPSGYTAARPAATESNGTYATSVFTKLGDAGAGHSASDTVYRLFAVRSKTCYGIRLRVAQSQYANYPAGSIKKFTDADAMTIQMQLRGLIDTIRLGDTPVTFVTAK